MAAARECDAPIADIHPGSAIPADVDSQLREVIGAATQMGARIANAAGKQIGDRHARVRRLGLVTHDGDGRARIGSSQRLGGDDAGGAGADDDVLHDPRSARAKPIPAPAS